jgi:hypothetical protein
MKKVWMTIAIVLSLILFSQESWSQCSICTKTAQQLGEKAGKGLNGGIIYLAAAPLLIVGFIGYQWWKNNRSS